MADANYGGVRRDPADRRPDRRKREDDAAPGPQKAGAEERDHGFFGQRDYVWQETETPIALEMDHRSVGPDHPDAAERLRRAVAERLSSTLGVGDIDVLFHDGEVILSGEVAGEGIRRRAGDCAETTPGVRHVRNALQVRGRPRPKNLR